MSQLDGTQTVRNDNESVEFVLIGTLEGDQSFARAWVRKVGSRNKREVKVGSRIDEAVVIKIGRAYIDVKINAKTRRVNVDETITAPLTDEEMKRAILLPFVPRDELVDGGDASAEVSRKELLKVLADQNRLQEGLLVNARLHKGKVKGYNIIDLSPNHILYKLGARRGDTVHSVNGFKLNGAGILFELWEVLPGVSKITMEIQRKRQLIRHHINLIDG